MRRVVLHGRGELEEWRDAARRLLLDRVPPQAVCFHMRTDCPDLFRAPEQEAWEPGVTPGGGLSPMAVSRAFIEAARAAICHVDPERFGLLYRLVWRLQEERELLQVSSDPDVVHLSRLVRNIRRDSHKMKAFVRFREIASKETGRRRFVAWFEPDHFIVAHTAPFFRRRFADMDWLIATPKGSAAWDGEELTLSSEPVAKPEAEDATDDLWRTYYANIFNPARLKIQAMQSEMPKKYWKNMPEASLIPDLIAGAERRVLDMAAREASQPQAFHERLQAVWRGKEAEACDVPTDPLAALKLDAEACTRCPLHCQATQTVFGEGPVGAEIMFVGEQPGDREDLAGRPFVGPAGAVFDEAIAAAGIDRSGSYVTNAVKHFKYEMRGKRRIHQKPNLGEIEHCRWWLSRELDLVHPKIVVALGASAYFALTGERRSLADVRGYPISLAEGRMLFVSVHPAYLLRIPDQEQRLREIEKFREDMVSIERLRQVS